MRFKLGPSKNERAYAFGQWHYWFAWRPVRLEWRDGRSNRGGVWLEWVCRRRVEKPSSSVYGTGSVWEYRLQGEVTVTPRDGAIELRSA